MSGKPKRVCELTMVFGSGEPCKSCLLYHSGAAQAQGRREGAKKGVEEQRLEQTDVFKKLSWQMKTTKNKLRWYRQQPQRLFLQIFLKRAHARKQKKGKNELLRNLLCNLLRNLLRNLLGNLLRNPLNLAWLCTKASWNLLRNLLRNPVEPDLALHQSLLEPSPEPSSEPCWTWPGFASKPPRLPNLLRNLLRNFLRNSVEPDLALHQSLPDLLRNLLRNPVEPHLALHQSLPELLRNLLRNPVEPNLALHWSFPDFLGTFSELSPKPGWTWPGSAPMEPSREPSPGWAWPGSALKPATPSPEPSRPGFGPKPPRPSPALHQSLPDLLWDLLKEPCWTWPGSAPSFPEPSTEPCWTWPGSAPKPPRPSPEPSLGTFSGTLLNLTWLCTMQGFLEPSPEPSPEPWTWPGSAPEASQTFSGNFGASLNLTRRLHQCTPELFWGEDPISLRGWEKNQTSTEPPLKLHSGHYTLSSDSMTTNRERVCSKTVAKNDAFAFRIWWQRALYCLASLPCIACRIPFWSSTMWGSRQSRFEPVARDRCSLHFSSFLSCHCHLRKSIRLIAHRKGLRASRTYRTLELHWTSFNFYNLVYACLRLLRWLPSGPCFKWWTAAVQGQTSGWCHAPLTLFRGSTSYLSKKPGSHFNPVDDSMLPAPIVGCPRLMWAIALRACWYCRGSYYLAPGFTCGSFQHIPVQYWIHHSSPVFLSHLQSRNWRPFQVPLWLCQLWYRAVDSADSWGDLLS